MQIIPVNDKATHQLFMRVPLIIYKNDVLKALQLGLNIINDNWIIWD